MSPPLKRFIVAFCGLITLGGLGLLYLTGVGPYLYCLARESQWLASKTEAELDSHMAFSPKRVITPADSGWGRKYKMKPGERMVQYLILNQQPLEAVFDRDSQVVVVFTSYE